jgi:long-chain fatty acid transport protein
MNTSYKQLIVVFLIALLGQTAFGAGFEKVVGWGAKEQGMAGAVVSTASGPDAIFFNPAGLINQDDLQVLTVNFSPTFSEFKAPFLVANQQETSESGFSPLFGVNYSYKVQDNLVVSMGGYVAGGLNTEYKDLSLASLGIPPSTYDVDFKSSLQMTELAIGAGYEIMEGLSVGASWRIAFVSAELQSFDLIADNDAGGPNGSIILNPKYENLESTEYSGLRLGAQYSPEDSWGIGFSYRSVIQFDTEGDLAGSYLNTGAAQPLLGFSSGVGSLDGDAKLKSSLPQQLNIGGHYNVMSDLTIALEYSWTDYSSIDKIEVETTRSGVTTKSEIETKWKDQNVFRIGLEYLGMGFPLRFGYAHTSQVVGVDNATPTFSSPGDGSDITLGAGYTLMDGLNVDLAFDYAFSSGDVPASADSTEGKYESSATQLHISAAYSF